LVSYAVVLATSAGREEVALRSRTLEKIRRAAAFKRDCSLSNM